MKHFWRTACDTAGSRRCQVFGALLVAGPLTAFDWFMLSIGPFRDTISVLLYTSRQNIGVTDMVSDLSLSGFPVIVDVNTHFSFHAVRVESTTLSCCYPYFSILATKLPGGTVIVHCYTTMSLRSWTAFGVVYLQLRRGYGRPGPLQVGDTGCDIAPGGQDKVMDAGSVAVARRAAAAAE
jgi:hypothetical protein